MSKKIATDDIASQLASGSVFFRPAAPAQEPDETSAPPVVPVRPARRVASSRASNSDSTFDSNLASAPASSRDSSTASSPDSSGDSSRASAADNEQARKQASTVASPLADSLASTLASSGDLADAIYRVVKKTGKHVAYVRTTEREKAELTAVLDGISETHGYKVTETELIRIAICSLLADYAEKGSDSLLMRVVTDLKD
jgi:hypothetical protein